MGGAVSCGAAIDPARCRKRDEMSKSAVSRLLGLALGLASIGAALAQGAVTANIKIDVLKGAWVRPDGGYTIVIKSIGPGGRLEAMYFNPNQLPFAKAQASLEGATLRVSFELQAGGYAGSTYHLTYDAASDRLKGTYYQAVAKQKFDIYFARK